MNRGTGDLILEAATAILKEKEYAMRTFSRTILLTILLLTSLAVYSGAGDSEIKNTVHVSLKDLSIDMPVSIPSGPTVFRISNGGSTFHSFKLQGECGVHELPAGLLPGQEQTLEIFLKPDSYIVTCPVANHSGMGMKRVLTVTK